MHRSYAFLYSFLAVLFLSSLTSFGQERVVRGKVVSEYDYQGIPGTSVLIEGSTVGVVTDLNGEYSISVPNNDTMLSFSFIGFEKKTIKAGNKTVIDVVLRESVTMLDQIQVTAFGIEKQKKSLGYATTTINAKELTKGDNSSAINSLQGKVAGLRIQSNPGVGTSQGIVLRGYTSISGNNQPLFVVDGVPLSNSSYGNTGLDQNYNSGSMINGLNPKDIESITILKGASATALYGSRAANGVVVIVTQKGSKNNKKLSISYSLGLGFTDVLRVPEFQNTFGQGWSAQHLLNENGSWGPRFDGKVREWGRIYEDPQTEIKYQKIKPFVAQPSNFRDFFERGYYIRNNLSLSGASSGNNKTRTSYYLSIGQNREIGNLPYEKDNYTRYNLNLKVTHEFNYINDKKVKLYGSITFEPQEISGAPGGQSLSSAADNLMQIPRDFSIVDYKDLDDVFNGLDYYYSEYGITNPYLVLKNLNITNSINQWRGNLSAEIDLISNLKFTYRVGYNRTNAQNIRKIPRLIPTPGTPNGGSSTILRGSFGITNNNNYEVNHDMLLSYDKELEQGFSLDALVGLSINERGSDFTNVGTNDQVLTSYFGLDNTTQPVNSDSYFSKRRLIGLFASANIGYKDFLYLTLTGRNDWSSTLPLANNTFFYPSATIGFSFSDLLPEKVQEVLSYGKLRVAYGFTGNDAAPYKVNSVYVPASASNPFRAITFPLRGRNAYTRSSRLGNNNLKPELSSELEVGLELAFFDYRFGIDVATYLKNTVNQILDVPIAASTGYSFQTRNIGNIENKGIELSLFVYPVKTNDFSWKITGNISLNRSNVISIGEGEAEDEDEERRIAVSGAGFSGFNLVLIEGREFPLFEGPAVRTHNGKIVVDSNGIPLASEENQILGSAQTDYDWGVSTDFKFKNWSLSATIDGRVGGLLYSRTASIGAFTGNLLQTTYNDRKPFVVPNSVQLDEETNTYSENTTPVDREHMDDYYQTGGDKRGLAFLLPRDFMKIRELSLTYHFSPEMLKKLPVSSFSLSVVGRNLALFTPAENNLIDPEASTFGTGLDGQFGDFSSTAPALYTWGMTLTAGL